MTMGVFLRDKNIPRLAGAREIWLCCTWHLLFVSETECCSSLGALWLRLGGLLGVFGSLSEVGGGSGVLMICL